MCDTMVALGNSTIDRSVIFAKNSDRQPNEPLVMVRVPRMKHSPNERLNCTYIEIDQVDETYEILLLKPSWIWGCEMGSNEFGLNIGNEAVFTKEKQGEDALIGMDMVRIALERCKTSDEALDTMIELLERYGQGGNCGYEKQFTYHNSFLIADRKSAWVLETAGKYWVAEKVKDVRSISNCLTIKNNFDKCHPELIDHAMTKGWCMGEEDFDFSRCYSNHLVTKLSGARERHLYTSSVLRKEKGYITPITMREILRHHENHVNENKFTKHSLKSICMHGGFLYGDHTTGSYIASLDNKLDTYWITGSSTPCISIFKPYWLLPNEKLAFSEDEMSRAIEFWMFREKLHRMVLENKIHDLQKYRERIKSIEKEVDDMIEKIDYNNINKENLADIIEYAQEKEEKLLKEEIEKNRNTKGKIKGNLYYQYYWNKQNAKLKI